MVPNTTAKAIRPATLFFCWGSSSTLLESPAAIARVMASCSARSTMSRYRGKNRNDSTSSQGPPR